MTVRDVQLAIQRRDAKLEPNRIFWTGVLKSIEGSVAVPVKFGKPKHSWVALDNQPEAVHQILNKRAANVAGNLVKIGWPEKPPFIIQVLDTWDPMTDLNIPAGDAGALTSGPHGQAHQMPSESNPGEDPVLVYQPALQLLKTTGDGLTLTVTTQALSHTTKDFLGIQTDLTASVPAGPTEKRQVLVYLDSNTNTIKTVNGSIVPDLITFTAPKPTVPEGGVYSAHVLLRDGQSTITTATDIDDARTFLSPVDRNPFRWIVADAAARLALPGLVIGDLNRLALQLDDNTVWLLTAISPATWAQIGGGGPVSNVHIIDDSGTNNIATAVTLNHGTDQTPTTGIGVRLAAETDNTTAEDAPIGNLDWWWSSMSNQRSNIQLSARSFGNEMPLMTLMPHSTATTAPGNFNTGSVDIQVHRTNSNQIAPPEGVCIGLRCQGGVTGAPFPSIIVGKDIVNAEWRNVAYGMDITMSPGEFCTAIGPSVTTNQDHTTAVGYLALARRARTTNIAGTMVLKRDAGTFSSHMVNFSSAEVFIATQEEDLTTTFDRTLGPLATSLRFFISEVGIIVTSITNMTVQPTIRAGIVGNLAKQVAAVQTTNLTAAYKRERFNPLVPDDGEPSLSVGVTVGATADVMLGRFYMKGLLLEEE